MLTPKQELARKYAVLLRMRGKNPLPSREYDDRTPEKERRKQPIYKYAELWEEQAPDEWFTKEGWPQTQTIQTMLGRHWRLAAIDLDGPEAIEEWGRMRSGRRVPETWTSHSGGGGRHLWFTLPPGLPELGQVFLWRGDGKHRNVEFLCDKRLIMTPPSIHPTTGREYRWLDRKHMPDAPGLGLPAMIPDWVLDRVVEISRPKEFFKPRHNPIPAPHYKGERMPTRDELLACCDKIGLARRYGVRFTGRSRNGWHEAHSIDREDRNPSAAIHETTGVYVDKGRDVTLSYIDLLIELGAGRDFKEVAAVLSGAR